MDQILRGIVASNYPENVKKSLILQFVSKATNSVAEEQSKAVFEIGAEWMTEERSRFLNETGKFVLITWAKRHKSDFQNYFTEDFLLSFLSKRKEICVSALDYIRTTFDLLQHTSQVFSMYTVVRHRIHIWVQQNTSIEFCAAVARLLIEFDHCWPVGENLLQFNLELIHALSKTELPKTSKQEMTLCIQNGAVIGALLNKMWMKNQALLFPVLAEVFKIISTVGPNPSVALASVVQYFPSDVIDTATKLVASNPSVSDGNLTLALGRMLNWLSWPGGKKVDQWIVGFLRALSVVGKNPILIAVTLEKVTQVFSRLFFPVVRESTMVVLSHMLLSFQHSPQAFHEIVELVPPLVESLKKENSVSSQFTLQSLAELMHCLMYQHTGFPELYGQLLDCLQDLPKPSEVMVKKWLTQSAWSAQSVKLPLIDLTPKSETGKIGLVNLGNTCYMNSVLQALYMLDEFRCMTFQQQTTSSQQQPLLYHLQEVFAFLTLSQRSAFAPSKFLRVARPPWFAVGSQQDCSEFLKFLLDRTSEEDNSINSTNGKPKRPSLVDETFAGKLLVCHRCRQCNSTSCREEVFTDLPLAFPQAGELEGRSVASADNATSTKHAVENIDMTAGSNPTRTTERSLKGGDISQHVSSSDISVKSSDETNRDAAASAVSSHEPGSSGLSMSFSKGTSVPTKCHEPAVTSAAPVISINDLLEYFFEAEVLEGSNQYHCEACQSLQDAERSVVISKASNFLVLTLKRFAYNVRTQQRSKILQSVSYPVILRLPSTFVKGNAAVVSNYSGDWVDIGSHPTHDRDDNLLADSGFSPKRTKQEHDGITDVSSSIDKPLLDCFYGLCSVIVHSGTSSESGHYYCYAQSSGNLTSGKSVEAATEEASSSQRNDSDTWHLFNDSRVSYSSFSSFAELSKRFPKDTPYVLIYKRLGSYRVTDSPYREEAAIQTEFTPVGEIRKELVDVVNHDNLLYLQEREKQAATMAKRKSNTYHPPDDDDDDENGKGPSGSCGSGPGFTTPFNRFVF